MKRKNLCRIPLMPVGGAASLVVSQSRLLDLAQPAHPGGDAGSSAHQGRLSAAAQSPAPGKKQKWRVRISIFGLRLPARPGGDAGSSAHQGRLSAAAQSPAHGKKQKWRV